MNTTLTPILDGVPLREGGRPKKGDRREKVQGLKISVPKTIKAMAKEKAKRDGVSLSAVISRMLAEWVDEDTCQAA